MGKITDFPGGPAAQAAAGSAARSGGGCRSRGRRRREGGLRPTDVVGAFFVAGLAFILAGAIVAVAGSAVSWGWTRWLALHLVFVCVSQLVLGASQFFLRLAGTLVAVARPSV